MAVGHRYIENVLKKDIELEEILKNIEKNQKYDNKIS